MVNLDLNMKNYLIDFIFQDYYNSYDNGPLTSENMKHNFELYLSNGSKYFVPLPTE